MRITHLTLLPIPGELWAGQSNNASRRIGLVWRRGYPKVQDLALLGNLVRNNPPSGTRAVSCIAVAS